MRTNTKPIIRTEFIPKDFDWWYNYWAPEEEKSMKITVEEYYECGDE